MMSSIYRSILVMVIFIISPIELLDGETFKGNVVFSGNPPEEPKVTTKGITSIDGDLTFQNYDQIALDAASFGPFAGLLKVSGTVTIKNLSGSDFSNMKVLQEIGGDFIMENNPVLETVNFLKNNVSVKGSIKGQNCPKLYNKEYSYLISVDEKYLNLFDEDSFTFNGDVNLLTNMQIEDKIVISGSLICNSATRQAPNYRDFSKNEVLALSLKKVVSVKNFLFDNCPITSLSSTFPTLRKVEDKVEIINCEKLVDKKFSDWLYKMKINTNKMVLKNNTNVCLERQHVDEWTKKSATISKHKTCNGIVGDVDLSKPSTLIPDTTLVDGKIFCNDIKGTGFTPEVMNFLKNIKMVTSLEFIRCEPLINFKTLFPNGLPEVGNVTITNCPNFESDVDVLALVNGTSESLTMTDNDKMCFTEAQLQSLFSKSSIKQSDNCAKSEDSSTPPEDSDEKSHSTMNVLDILYLSIVIRFLF